MLMIFTVIQNQVCAIYPEKKGVVQKCNTGEVAIGDLLKNYANPLHALFLLELGRGQNSSACTKGGGVGD